jgi:hypothetical protein
MHWNLLAGLALVTGGILFGVRQAKKSEMAPAPLSTSTPMPSAAQAGDKP